MTLDHLHPPAFSLPSFPSLLPHELAILDDALDDVSDIGESFIAHRLRRRCRTLRSSLIPFALCHVSIVALAIVTNIVDVDVADPPPLRCAPFSLSSSSSSSLLTTLLAVVVSSIIAVVIVVVVDPPLLQVRPPPLYHRHHHRLLAYLFFDDQVHVAISRDQVRFLFGMVVRELVYIGLVVPSFPLFFVPLSRLSLLILSHRGPSSSPTLTDTHRPSPTLTYLHLPLPTPINPHLSSSTFTHPRLSSSTRTHPRPRSPTLVHPYPHPHSPSYSVCTSLTCVISGDTVGLGRHSRA